MGSASTHAGRDEGPVHIVQLAGYCLDLHEARADAVGAWARETGRTLQGEDLANVDAAGAVAPGKADHPATGLSWSDAQAFCAAQGKALPTEAQWEKAARGGCERGEDPAACDPADLRAYPWGGAAPTCALANHQSGGMPGPPELCVGGTLPVDALPGGAGPYGHLHLAGNAWEWVADAYHPAVYAEPGRTDPGGPSGGPWRGLRGGGWSTFATNMRAANRFQDLVMGSPTGVRCARPTVAATPDPVAPLELVEISGEVLPAEGTLRGRALYITAFDAADVDPATGMLVPGRSPAAEVRLTPGGGERQAFTLGVPAGGTYRLSAALDGGPVQGDAFVAASGSGGMGEAEQNPVQADADVDGIRIRLQAPPAHGPAGAAGAQGPGKHRGKAPGGGPPRPRGGPGR
jgi:formylglycine-generating enzyme required for sulfatase activity